MVSIIPQTGLGDLLGMSVGQGIQQGMDAANQQIIKNAASKKLMQILGIGPTEQIQTGAPDQSVQKQSAQGIEITPEKIMALAADPELAQMAPTVAKLYETQQSEKRSQQEMEFKREKMSEEKLLEKEDKLRSLEQSGMRFERLENLFSPELEEKFPARFAVGMFTKDGELSPKFQALLTPEAEEALKLVTDEIKGAKDTFGARVTNFDASTYLKTLPGLLNSAEGRRRVLRDLRIMNELNQMHEKGVLDIIHEHGGPGKMSLSKAESIFRKTHGEALKKYNEEFVKPGSHVIDFPQFYTGKTIRDTETDQLLKSNGKEWVLQ